MKELYIIRHGETELNRLGIVQGRGVNSDLNDTGRAQASAFFEHYKNVKFDKIYTSTLKRTHQTVQKFIDLGIPWQQLAGLDELAWGIWEGQPNTEHSRHAFLQMSESWQAGNFDAKFEGGESPNDVLKRLQESAELINRNTEEKTILICMHGRAMRLFLCLLLNKSLSEMTEFPHKNTTLYRLQLTEEGCSVLDFNNINHLENI